MLMRRMAAGCAALVAMLWWTAASADVITCESGDGQNKFCPANTQGGVSLQTQLSRASCRQGETWGYDRGGIWTANGCRARFVVGSRSYDDPARASGKSNAAAAVAALAIVAAGAAAVHHHDQKDRRDRDSNYQNDSYGYDYTPPQPYGYSRYGGAETLSCDSEDGRQRYCPVDTRGARVELTRQKSRSECRFGRNWGYDRRGVWVNGGCRGEFSVYRN